MHGTTKTDFCNVISRDFYELADKIYTMYNDITGHVHKLETLYTMPVEMLHTFSYVIIAID